MSTTVLGTRAVIRRIEALNRGACPHCGEDVKFISKQRSNDRIQVVCNVYEQGKWNRVEHWHKACYDLAGSPHGEAQGKIT